MDGSMDGERQKLLRLEVELTSRVSILQAQLMAVIMYRHRERVMGLNRHILTLDEEAGYLTKKYWKMEDRGR